MVHGVEVVAVEGVDVVNIHCVNIEQSDLDTTLGETNNGCSRLGIDSRRTHEHENAGTVHLNKLLAAGNFLIHVKPHVLCKYSKVNRIS